VHERAANCLNSFQVKIAKNRYPLFYLAKKREIKVSDVTKPQHHCLTTEQIVHFGADQLFSMNHSMIVEPKFSFTHEVLYFWSVPGGVDHAQRPKGLMRVKCINQEMFLSYRAW
jgi:hypothetical protein